MPVQTLLLPTWLLPIRPARTVWRDHAVLVEGERIVGVMPAAEAVDAYPEAEQVRLPGHVPMPGLINMHTHSPMALFRGMADDLELDTWLKQHIWPAEQRWVSPDFVRDGTELAMLEMLRAGTTAFNEMYFFPEVIAESADAAGLRAMIGVPIIELETPWAKGLDDCLARARDVVDQATDRPLLDVGLAPHAVYTVSDAAISQVSRWSAEWDISVGIHLLEAGWERRYSEDHHGMGALQWLHHHELTGDRLQTVHMVHVGPADIELLVETGTHVVHCPNSNLKLSSGIAPASAMLEAGVNLCIGTDGAASNNRLDVLGEMRVASLLAKGSSGDPCTFDAHSALEAVTLSAARALRKGDELGSIEAGKQADLVAFDLRCPETQPVHDVASQMAYAAAASQCRHVWVAGRQVLKDGVATTLDEQAVLAKAREWNRRLASKEAE